LSLPAEQFQGGEEPPHQVWRGWDSFRIFYNFFNQNPRSHASAVTSSSVTSHRAYPQNDPGWRGTSRPSLARIRQFPNFLRFFKAKSVILSGRRDVIVNDVTSRLPAERSRGGEEPPGQVWRGSDSFRIFYNFLKQNPSSRASAVTSSSVTSHRAYPQNDPGVARNLQAKFGADRTVSEFSMIFQSEIRGSIRSM
jgi:hypothetical protein